MAYKVGPITLQWNDKILLKVITRIVQFNPFNFIGKGTLRIGKNTIE